jgi:hypothetical protein
MYPLNGPDAAYAMPWRAFLWPRGGRRAPAPQRIYQLRLALGTDANHLTWHRPGDRRPKRRDQRDEIAHAIARRVEHDLGGGHVLLIREIPINRDEDVKAGLAPETEQDPVAIAGPSFVLDVRDRKVSELTPKSTWHTLIEQKLLHAAETRATSISFASSRTAMA